MTKFNFPEVPMGSERVIAWLQEICDTDTGPYLRPFAPNSNWQNSPVFIVGTNPATPLRAEFPSFASYWTALTKNVASFNDIYLAKRRGKISPTSMRARLFEQALGKINVLRTNAAILPIECWSKLPERKQKQHLQTGRHVLEALVGICRPRVILCHGKPAIDVVSSLFSLALDPYVPLIEQQNNAKLFLDSPTVRIFAYPHMSGLGVERGFAVRKMNDELAALARTLVRELDTLPESPAL